MSASGTSSTSDWEPPLPDELQRMLSSYEVTGILGRGGMGAVYKGIQRNLDRPVAIKVLPETFSKGGDELNFVARFKQEARAMAKMAHPAIISVYDFGETENGQLYFVMEFIDGMDIHQYAKAHGGKLPQEHALNIVAHVLDALEYAHHMGIVHRDIKPANILINREGRVKIADFGLAKKFGSGADQSQPALTMSNVAVGTPDFVAPESLEAGRVVDHRADLYAVGVMLYQLLTGRLPRGQFKPPSEAVPGLDPRLDAIVSRAMQTEPEDRYPNAAAVRADLDVIFSRPMARVEAGAETEDIPVAVPVTTSVKEGAKPAGTAVKAVTGRKPGPGNTRPVRPSVPVEKEMAGPNRLPLFLGLGAAALLLVGLGYWIFGRGTPEASATITAVQNPAPTNPVPAVRPTAAIPSTPVTTAEAPKKSVQVGVSPKPAAPAAAVTEKFPPGQWVKLFTQFEELPDDLRKSDSGVKFDDGWIRFTPGQPKRIPIFNANANCGVRARVQRLTDKPQNRTTLVLRSDGTEISPFYRLYCANQLLVATKQSRDDTSYLFQAPIDDLPNGVGEYTMEFAVVGSNLIGRFGSQIPRVARGADLTGGISFITGEEAVRDIEVINLDGLPEAEALKILGIDKEGKNLRAPASSPPSITKEAPFPPGQWVKAFTKFEDLPTSLQAPEKGVKIEGGWIHLGNVASNWLYLPNELPSNFSIRATYRGGDPNDGSIIVRAQQTGQRYQVRLQAGKLLLQARDNDVFRTLAQADSTIAIEPASDSFTLELAAIGNKLVARMGSQMVQATIDPSHASGKNYLLGSQPLRDIEVMNLQGLPEAEALRLIGIDPQGNDLRALAAKEEVQQMEQTKAAEALAAVPELKALDDQFQKLTVERVTTPFEKGLAALNTNYLGGLDRAIADEKKAGHLDGVLALEQEKNQIAAGESVPLQVEPTAPESLKKLRVIYREALAKLVTERAANLKALTDPLILRLKQLEIELTKLDRVAHAKTVREYREALTIPPPANEGSLPALITPSQTPPPLQSTLTAPKSASNRVRPDPKVSRQAAEYALNLGASVTISANGAQLSILPGENLPKGDFELYRVSFPTDKGLSITDADLQAITEARELRHFATGDRNNTTITSLAPFQKTPLIENISCYQYLTITEEDCSLLASLPQLKAAHFLGGAAPVANLPLLLSAPSLQDVSFSSISLRSEDGEVLNRFPKLRRLVISSKTMDALLLKMGDMDGLVALSMPYATVSAAGFSALNPKLSETLEELAFGQTVDDSTAGLNTAIERFPSLKILSCRGSVSPEVTSRISSLKQIEKLTFYQASMSSETFLAIGQCRGLVELAIGRGTLAAPDLEALRRLRNLKKLSIRDNGIQIDPGAIPQFGKLDTLTTLELPESQVTEEQVKELKKALPKCAISRVGAYQ